jgi:threonine dehydrogenase-like Zn-dependent dehydrogenase
VLGCGPVGLMAVVGARELGATEVLAIDAVPERLALAESFGAEAVALAAARARVLALTDGRGADLVLEAVGSEAAGRLAFELVRPGGTISAAGVHTEPHFAFSPGQAYDKNLTYRAGRCPARAYMPRMLALIESARHPLARIISHRLPLSAGPRAYELFDQKLEGCTKVLFRP